MTPWIFVNRRVTWFYTREQGRLNQIPTSTI